MEDYLTLAIGSMSALLNPETVILAGEILRDSDPLITLVQRRLEGKIAHVPSIIASSLGHRAVAMGAIMMVLDATALNTEVTQLP